MEATLILILIIVSCAIGALALVSTIIRTIILFKYHMLNRRESSSNLTARELARKVLDANGLENVKVEKPGFFRMLFFGNHYSIRKKTIYLRGNIIDKNTVTAIGMATQKVGYALQDKNHTKGFKTRYICSILSAFSPLIFYTLLGIGLIIDVCTSFKGLGSNGSITILSLVIGIIYYLTVFIALLFNIKVEKKANAMAMEMLSKSNLLEDKDLRDLSGLLNSYVIADIIDYVISILELIQLILKFIFKALRLNKENKH